MRGFLIPPPQSSLGSHEHRIAGTTHFMTHDLVTPARNRALGALCAMVVGIWISKDALHLEAMTWFAIACGLVSVSIVIPSMLSNRFGWATRSGLMFIAIIAIGGGWFAFRIVQSPPDRLDAIVENQRRDLSANNERIPIQIQGTILDHVQTHHRDRRVGDPPMWSTQSTHTRIKVDRAYSVNQRGLGSWINATGIARVLLSNENLDGANESEAVNAGDRVEMIALYSSTNGARNLGDPDYRSMSAQSNQVGSLIVTDGSMIQVLNTNGLWGKSRSAILKARGLIQWRALSAIGAIDTQSSASNREQRGMLSALLLGQRDPGFGEVYKSFQRVGVSHVLAISGFHLALVIFLGVFAIRIVGEHPRIEVWVIVSILVIGALIIPMRPPVVRAGSIVVAMLIAGSIGRRYDRLTILAWVGGALLIWRPLDAFSLGYQLSMGITALLVILADRSSHDALKNLAIPASDVSKRSAGVWSRCARKLGAVMQINIACWLVAMPAIMYHAGIVSVLAPLVSVVLIPMVMVLMIVGYVQIAIGVVSPELASNTIVVTDGLAHIVRWFVVEVDGWSGSSFRSGQPSAIWTLIATFIVALIVTKRWKLKRALTMSCACVIIIWFGISTLAWNGNALLRIDMIDVGDGSCIIVGSGSDGIIWDCGSLDRRVADSIVQAVHHRRIRIRDVVITHDNIDHYNALLDLVSELGVERVWITQRMIQSPSKTWTHFAKQLSMMGINIKELAIDQQLAVGHATIECLWPDPAQLEGLGDNDTSAVVMVRVQTNATEPIARSILLCGDIEGDAIRQIFNAHPHLRPDIMELPHHGSAKSDAIEFVNQINPSVVLQSTGPSRLNDQRWDHVRNQRVWYATALRGGAWVAISKDGTITHGWAVKDALRRD